MLFLQLQPCLCKHHQDWSSKHNAAFSYYAYHIYANLFTLNKLRESRGLNTFTFRCAPGAWLSNWHAYISCTPSSGHTATPICQFSC